MAGRGDSGAAGAGEAGPGDRATTGEAGAEEAPDVGGTAAAQPPAGGAGSPDGEKASCTTGLAAGEELEGADVAAGDGTS